MRGARRLLPVAALFAATAAAAEFAGTLKELELDSPGGAGGAPSGMAFIVPPGSTTTATFGDLGGGVSGIHFEVKQAGDALVCSQLVPLGPQAYVKARVRVPAITPGAGGWMGLNFELRARDSAGALVSPPGGQYILIKNLREPGDWQDVDGKLTVPAGATQGEFCFRFVLSTGAMDLDKLSIVSRDAGGAAAAPAPAPMPDPLPVAAPLPVVAPPVGGAPEPKGKDKGKKAEPAALATAPAPVMTTAVATAPTATVASAGDSAASRGFTLRLDQRASSVACTRWFPSQSSVTVFGSADVSTINPDAVDWSGLAIEAYARDSADKPLAPGGVPYSPIFVTTQAGLAQRFSVAWTPPAGASRVRLCARLSDAAGSTVFDWK